MDNQIYTISETIQNVDESNHSFTSSLDEGSIQFPDMKFTFPLISKGETKSNLTMSTSVVNPDAQFMAKNLFEMMCQGLKKIYEL